MKWRMHSQFDVNFLVLSLYLPIGYAGKGIDQIVDKFESEKVAVANGRKTEQEEVQKGVNQPSDDHPLPMEDIKTRVFLR